MKSPYISKKYWNFSKGQLAESADSAYQYDDLINLTLGDPDITTDERIIKGAFEGALNGHTHYTESVGMRELRQKIMELYLEDYSYSLSLEEIMVTTSACHGMWLVMQGILDPGDEVIIPSPYFSPYKDQVEMAEGVPVFVPMYEEEGYQLSMERLESKISTKTKAIIVNTPNNPIGSCLNRESLENIARIAKKHDLLIIADDIYTIYSFQEPFIPITSLEGMKERTITLGSFSKNFAMTGWRLGYVLAPDYIIEVLKSINENNVYSPPSISQIAGIYAIDLRKEIYDDLLDLFKERVYYAYNRLKVLKGVEILEPMGTFYLFPSIKGTGLSSKEITKLILNKAHVAVVPGTAFGDEGEGYIRIAATLSMEDLKTAFDRLEKLNIFK